VEFTLECSTRKLTNERSLLYLYGHLANKKSFIHGAIIIQLSDVSAADWLS